MILIEWLLGKIDHSDLHSLRDEASEAVRKKLARVEQEQAANAYNEAKMKIQYSPMYQSKIYPHDAYVSEQSYRLKPPKRPELAYLSPEEKIKIVSYGKSWKERNLKILEERREEPFAPNSTYFVSLVDHTGNDILISQKEWRTESDTVPPVSLVFDIPANTPIVGLLIYDGKGNIVKSKKFDITAQSQKSIFTLNCKLE